jgi:hypothetical protein
MDFNTGNSDERASRTIDRVPNKHLAGLETAANFTNVVVIKRHPILSLLDWDSAGLRNLEEARCAEVLHHAQGVPRPLVVCGIAPDTKRCRQDGALRRRMPIASVTGPHNERTK